MKTIRLPENSLVVLCGVAGCGKSTFAAKHFLPTAIVSSDDCRARLSDDETNQQVTGHAFELWRFIIRKRLYLGRLTVADATNLERGDRKWLLGAAHDQNFRAAVMLFDIALATALRRNRQRARVVPEEAILKQHELLQETLRSLTSEGFDAVFIFGEQEQSEVQIEIEKADAPLS